MFRNDRPEPLRNAGCGALARDAELVIGGDENVGEAEDRFIERDVDLLSCAVLRIAMIEGEHHRERAHDGGLVIGHCGSGPQRWPVGLAGDVEQSRKCQSDPIIGGARGVGPGLPVTGDTEHYETRIDGLQCSESDPPFVERSGTKILHQHIGLCREVAEDALALRQPQIERD